LATRFTQMAKVTTGSSLSISASSSHGRYGRGPASPTADGKAGDSRGSSSMCLRSGRDSDDRKMSFGVRFCGKDGFEPLGLVLPVLPLDAGVMEPYDPGPGPFRSREADADWDKLGSSLMVAGTSTGRKADASNSALYSLSRSCGIDESSRQSMYMYCWISSLVRS